jgi:hypothetical protein
MQGQGPPPVDFARTKFDGQKAIYCNDICLGNIDSKAERFSVDFTLKLTAAELKVLRSQFVTSSQQRDGERVNTPNSSQDAMSSAQSHVSGATVQNWSQIATSSHGGRWCY